MNLLAENTDLYKIYPKVIKNINKILQIKIENIKKKN